jgi:hypothetical protein
MAVPGSPIGDTRQNTERLESVAAVLACKIWRGLAQGARAEMRPASWHTVLHFTRDYTG